MFPEFIIGKTGYFQLFLNSIMEKYSPQQVQAYYDQFTDSYMEIYGDVIQAFRPSDTTQLLDYVGRSAGINWGMKVLDLGCGVAGPAIHFAYRWNAGVTGITISPVQYEMGLEKIRKAQQENNIHLLLGDYHQLSQLPLQDNYFDIALFLESLGHSNDVPIALENAYNKVKLSGKIYIKDFFKRKAATAEEQQKIDHVVENINRYYNYNTLDLEETVGALTTAGWGNVVVQPFDFIDDITVRYQFEKVNGIDIFEGQPEFYPADWLQITAHKMI